MKLYCMTAFLSSLVFIVLFWLMGVDLKVWTPVVVWFALHGVGWLVARRRSHVP